MRQKLRKYSIIKDQWHQHPISELTVQQVRPLEEEPGGSSCKWAFHPNLFLVNSLFSLTTLGFRLLSSTPSKGTPNYLT